MNDNEKKLIKKCAKGNIEAFEELIKNYEKTTYNIALKILKNREDAMDISQDALLKVFRSINTFNYESSFSTWLYRIVTNTCLDFLRKNKGKTISIDEPIETSEGQVYREIADTSYTPEEILDKEITKEIVRTSIDKLDDIHRTVIILRDLQEFSYEEISQILDCSIGTVKSRISRARNNLREIILLEMEQNNEAIV